VIRAFDDFRQRTSGICEVQQSISIFKTQISQVERPAVDLDFVLQ
jgi:hypothetical protein